jgi:hypothetical protein
LKGKEKDFCPSNDHGPKAYQVFLLIMLANVTFNHWQNLEVDLPSINNQESSFYEEEGLQVH